MPAQRDAKGRVVKGSVLNPNGRRVVRRDDAADPVEHYDGFANASLGFGTSADKRSGAGYVPDLLSYTQLAQVWRASDIAARLIETLPRESLAKGWEIHIDDEGEHGDLRERVETMLADLEIDQTLERVLSWERAFGGGALLLGANDGQDMSMPLDMDRVIELLWVTPLEPIELVAARAYEDPNHPKHGRTSHYEIQALSTTTTGDLLQRTLPAGHQLVHESRVVVLPGIRVSKFATNSPAGSTWGDSVLTRAWRAILDFDQAFASIGVILTEQGLPVFSMVDLAKLVNQGRSDVVRARLSVLFQQMSTARAAVLDAQEKYERQGTPLTGLPEIIDRVAMRLCAACEMPLTKLLGRSPAGMNATGEGDLEGWYSVVETYQRQRVRPILRRVIEVAMAATHMQAPKSWSIRWTPQWIPSEKEVAETRATLASADEIYLTNGVLSPREVRRARFKGQYSIEVSADDEDTDEFDAIDREQITAEDREALTLPAPKTGPAGGPVANTALNGVQVTSMLEVVRAYGRGELERGSAKAILLASFPTITPEQADSMLPEGWRVATPAPANGNEPAPAQNDNTEAKPGEKVSA